MSLNSLIIKIVTIVPLIASSLIALSQGEIAQKINDEWYINIGSRGLRVGDTVPDIELGIVLNNKAGIKRFSDLKGKLVILDFWNTGCAACIAKFPSLEELQSEFDDKIQILLVNPFETSQQVEERIGKNSRRKNLLPDLPVIVSDRPYVSNTVTESPLFKIFPHREVPHHAWIDQNGIVILVGGSENTYSSKIKDFLEGKPIYSLNDASSTPSILYGDRKKPYYKILGNFQKTDVAYGSFITSYNNELNGGRNEIVDEGSKVRITQFINEDLLDIYAYGPFLDFIRTVGANIIYAPITMRWKNFVIFAEGMDSSLFVSRPIYSTSPKIDTNIIKSGYCYEQVVPLNMIEERRLSSMLNDLNNYFETKIGVTAKSQNREVSYYALVRTSNADKTIISKKLSNNLRSLVEDAIQNSKALENQMINNQSEGKPFLVVNETGWEIEREIDIDLNNTIFSSIDQLNKALAQYDLKLVEKKQFFKFLVFSKAK